MSVNEKMTAIADAIRDKTGETNPLTLDDMATDIPKVYGAGKNAQHDEFWDDIQENGAFKSYQYAFGGGLWGDTTFKPKYPLNGTSFFRCFAESGIKNIEQTINVERCTSSASLQNMFYNAAVVTISEMKSSANTTFDSSTTFKGCSVLKNFNITGTIGKNGFNVSFCTYLSAASLLSILQACNKANAGVTVTLPKKCINGSTVTETYIANNTELSTALTNATTNGYTISFE